MNFLSVGLLLLSTALVNAFKDTSPFFFFSTSDILVSSPQIVSGPSINKEIALRLEACPSDIYVIVSQPGVNAVDFQGSVSAPHLRRKLSGDDRNIRSSLMVSDVIGKFDSTNLRRIVEEKCGATPLKIDASTGSFGIPKEPKVLVVSLDFPPLPNTSSRAAKLIEHDFFLASVLDLLPSSKYSVLYATTPSSADLHSNIVDSENYQIDTTFQFPTHLELKRDFSSHQRASNSTLRSTRAPLFEKYQFFGPGIFMGLLVSILLLSILYVAIRGVSSLQVSYAAFDKEMGPGTQKKHTQE
jgi:hypothetical protein